MSDKGNDCAGRVEKPGQLAGLLTLVALSLLPAAGSAQLTTTRFNPTIRFEFNYSNPGARSLAMGGAFAALADDATAAYTNPAGLSVLARPEFSIEARAWHYDISFLDSRFEPVSERTFELVVDEFVEPETSMNPSFVSFVWPSSRWALALYYHRLAKFEGNFSQFSPRSKTRTSDIDLNIAGFGAAFSCRLGYRLAIGAAVAVYDFAFRSEVITEDIFQIDPDAPVQRRISSLVQRGRETSVQASFGVLAELSRRFTAGAFVRRGPATELFEDSAKDLLGDTFRDTQPSGSFRAPTVAGVGLVFRPTLDVSLSLEYDIVRYSQILNDEDSSVYRTISFRPLRQQLIGRFDIEDAHEIRFGAELSLWDLPGSPALRIGGWFDPDHSIRFTAVPGQERFVTAERLAAFYSGREDRWHVTLGAGIVLRDRLQLDAGIDLSEGLDVGSLSAVYRF